MKKVKCSTHGLWRGGQGLHQLGHDGFNLWVGGVEVLRQAAHQNYDALAHGVETGMVGGRLEALFEDRQQGVDRVLPKETKKVAENWPEKGDCK